MNVDNHNGILFSAAAPPPTHTHKCEIGHFQRAFSGAVICCPVRYHSRSSPSQLMELQRAANGSSKRTGTSASEIEIHLV